MNTFGLQFEMWPLLTVRPRYCLETLLGSLCLSEFSLRADDRRCWCLFRVVTFHWQSPTPWGTDSEPRSRPLIVRHLNPRQTFVPYSNLLPLQKEIATGRGVPLKRIWRNRRRRRPFLQIPFYSELCQNCRWACFLIFLLIAMSYITWEFALW